MRDWYLSFHPPKDTDSVARVMSELVGPVATSGGELEGNPYDSYYGDLYLEARRGDLRVVATLTQSAATITSTPTTSGMSVRLEGPTFANKLAMWRALGAALAKVGCNEYTLKASGMANIVDEAEANDPAIASQLRAQITAALVEGPHGAFVSMQSTRPDDIEAVLASYPAPEAMGTVILTDLKLTAMPKSVARFINCESLTVNDLDGSGLRGLAFPRLVALHLDHSNVRTLTREDLAGFPALQELDLRESALEQLDPDIIDACPQLRRVRIAGTKVRADAALRARWKEVTWE